MRFLSSKHIFKTLKMNWGFAMFIFCYSLFILISAKNLNFHHVSIPSNITIKNFFEPLNSEF